jgi:hypothetical protein
MEDRGLAARAGALAVMLLLGAALPRTNQTVNFFGVSYCQRF